MSLESILVARKPEFENPVSLYVHIPFCASKCAYCDFHSFVRSTISPDLQSAYVDRVLGRVGKLASLLTGRFETIYIGGGTPTALDDQAFSRLIVALDKTAGGATREWTVEANPESLTQAKIDIMKSSSVSRISLGIQSMDENELAILGRKGNLADNKTALGLAANSGLSVSADLIASVPDSRGEVFRKKRQDELGPSPLETSVEYLLDSGVSHISIYDLVVEEGTPISRRLASGDLTIADEDEAWTSRKKAEKLLSERGFHRYEVSNYAPPGLECGHNMTYWRMRSYLGVGCSAVSTLNLTGGGVGALRIEEGRDFSRYLRAPEELETLTWISPRDSAFETIMMGLRTRNGVDSARFASRFSVELVPLLAPVIEKWRPHFCVAGERVFLEESGMDILNRILVDVLDYMNIFSGDRNHE